MYTHKQISSHKGVLWRDSGKEFQPQGGSHSEPLATSTFLAGDDDNEEGVKRNEVENQDDGEEEQWVDEDGDDEDGNGEDGEDSDDEEGEEGEDGSDGEGQDEEADTQLWALDEMYGAPDSADELYDD